MLTYEYNAEHPLLFRNRLKQARSPIAELPPLDAMRRPICTISLWFDLFSYDLLQVWPFRRFVKAHFIEKYHISIRLVLRTAVNLITTDKRKNALRVRGIDRYQ
jgi:hypothetical protein